MNFRVLIAEDSELNKLFLENIMTSFEVQFEFASNGKQAIDLLRIKDFDLILMDIEMPILNGIEALHIIRNEFLPPKSHIPVVAVSAHTERTYCLELLKNGFDRYLIKPYKRNEILDLIKFYFDENSRQNVGIGNHNRQIINNDENFYNIDNLKALAIDDEEFMNEILKIFINEIPSNLAIAKKHTENYNWKELGNILHKIAPACGFFGIHEIESKIHRIEEFIHSSKNLDEIPELIDLIINLTQKVVEQLKSDFNLNK